MPKIYFASDHSGFALKAALILYIRELGYEVEDMGTHAPQPDDDYPDYVTPCARAVAVDVTARGIIIGKSGQGEAMCANRVSGVRAAVYYAKNTGIIRLAREHNDANILSLGADFISEEDAKEAVKLFLETQFSRDERHVRRLSKF